MATVFGTTFFPVGKMFVCRLVNITILISMSIDSRQYKNDVRSIVSLSIVCWLNSKFVSLRIAYNNLSFCVKHSLMQTKRMALGQRLANSLSQFSKLCRIFIMKKANGGVWVYSCAIVPNKNSKYILFVCVYLFCFVSIIISHTGEEARQWYRKFLVNTLF